MDLLEGLSLDDLLEQHGVLSVERAAECMLEECKGLAAAG
jgi:hypothetical protein